ncbi:glycosyl transferase family 28, partial [Streptomyces sp. NPDC020801]
MRVLFTAFAAKSHAYTQFPLAWALRTAGHEVCVASQPDLVEDITRAGLTAVPVGRALQLSEQMGGADSEAEFQHLDEAALEILDYIYIQLQDVSAARSVDLTPADLQVRLTAMIWVLQELSADP